MSIFSKPIVIDVEGLIGAGKTTFINNCLIPILTRKGYKVSLIREPVDLWGEILPLFYKDPKRWGYHFQTKTIVDRIKVSKQTWDMKHKYTDIFICERGVWSDTFFMQTLYDQGHVNDMEYKHYNDWWNLWTEVLPFTPDIFIYLNPDIDEVMKRVRSRNRKGEEELTKSYQQLLKSKHDEVLDGSYIEISKNHYVPIHKIETNLDFKNDRNVQIKLANEVEKKIMNLCVNNNYNEKDEEIRFEKIIIEEYSYLYSLLGAILLIMLVMLFTYSEM